MTNTKLHPHFWFDLNKGESINASEGSSYHIQHVVRNPQKFGFNDKSEMQQHAKYNVEEIDDGIRDIDHNLEHHVMTKGFARGYSELPSRSRGKGQSGFIHFDVDNEENLGKALTHFRPHVEEAEANGNYVDVDANVGHKGNFSQLKSFTFSDAASIKAHLGKIAPRLQSKEPKTFQGVGQVSSALRKKIKDTIRKQDPSAPAWKLEQDTGYATGSWGDSVEYKTFKNCFSEALKKMGKKKKW